MRSVVMELAGQQGRPVQQMAVSPDDLAQAEEVFLTNSLIGIRPVRSIEERNYRVGPVTRELQIALAGLTAEGTDWMSDDMRGGADD
ncbi:MAG: aminotransferase class IV [Thiohalobacterales bacterium]|nr:aminotransferase class IV [Thiohalobacterales bacterium]